MRIHGGSRRSGSNSKGLAGIAVVSCAMAFGAAGAAGGGAPTSSPGSAADGTMGAFEPGSTVVGLVKPVRQATLASPQDGTLMTVAVVEGERVAAGQALATMDDRVARAAVELARVRAERSALIAEMEHALADAERTLERVAMSHQRSAAAPAELDSATLERDLAAARLRAEVESAAVAKAELELERQRLETLTIRAPFAGRIVRITARAGETLQVAEDILTIVSLDGLEAEFHVPARLFGALKVGGKLALQAEEPVGRSIEATVRFVSPVIDPSSRTIRVVFDIANKDEAMPAGFSVRFPEIVGTGLTSAEGDGVRSSN